MDPISGSAVNSPIKGLERLSEDLRQERQKATFALQDRARLRIEVESLRQQIQLQANEIKSYKQSSSSSEKQIAALTLEVESLKQTDKSMHFDWEEMRNWKAAAESELEKTRRSNESYVESLRKAQEQLDQLAFECNSLEGSVELKESQINELREEIMSHKKRAGEFEDKEIRLNDIIQEKNRELEDLRDRVKQSEILRESFHYQQLSTEEMKKELEKSFNTNQYLSLQVREVNAKFSDISSVCSELQASLTAVTSERDALIKENSEFEAMVEELSKRVRAESSFAEAEKHRADVCLKTKEFLEQQVQELRQAHGSLGEKNHEQENEIIVLNRQIGSLNSEIEHLREKLLEAEDRLAAQSSSQAVASEVETLRNQLSEVRKQLIRRGIDEETNLTNPKAVLERENQSRQVYEGVILDLRTEIDRINNKHIQVCLRLEEALSQAARADQLEEEVQMYRETAKAAALENQSVAISASEAVERSVRTSHDKHVLLSHVRQLESDLLQSGRDIQRFKDEIAEERQKHKALYMEKISAERKAAELLVAKARAETELDTLKQDCSIMKIEIDRLKKLLHEQGLVVEELKRKAAHAENSTNELDILRASLNASRNAQERRESESTAEIQMLRQSKQLLKQEVDSLKQTLHMKGECISANSEDLERLRREIQDLKLDRDRQKKEIALFESNRAELQLQSLRRDLESTVSDWKHAEQEKVAREEKIGQIQKEMSKEKEKSSLLRTQVSLLEERVRIANQELAVYRSLDVYHTSMQSELKHFRLSKSSDNQIDGESLSDSRTTKGKTETALHAEPFVGSQSRLYLSDMDDSHLNDRSGPIPAPVSVSVSVSAPVSGLGLRTDGFKSVPFSPASSPRMLTQNDISTPISEDYNHRDYRKDVAVPSQRQSAHPSQGQTLSESKPKAISRPLKTDFDRARRLLAKSNLN